jgi:pyrimidine deaminase RibD-like protein
MGDITAHGGTITIGFPTVLIGEAGAGAMAAAAFQKAAEGAMAVLPVGPCNNCGADHFESVK